MGPESGAGTGGTYEVTFALTDAEIEILKRMGREKLLKVARLGRYIGWINIAVGTVLSFSAGEIALRYLGVERGPSANTLVMTLFSFFLAGVSLNGWLLQRWSRQAYAHRILRHKAVVRVRLSGEGTTYLAKEREIRTAWTSIEEVTFLAGTMVLWVDPDTALTIPLRAISSPEERALMVEDVRSWIKTAAGNPARP